VSLFIGITLAIIGLLLLYALGLRRWLKNNGYAQQFFAWIEPAEIALFRKSETVLVGRLVWLGGLIVTIYDGITTYFIGLNWEPLTSRVMDFFHIPPDLRSFTLSAAVTGIGLAIVRLRKTTTKPLELVSTSDANIAPAAAKAMAKAEIAKDQAVAAVAEAKL